MAVNKIVVDLERWSDDVKEWAERGIETTADVAYNEPRRRIAVDTGDTRDAIDKTYKGYNGRVVVDSPIGIYLEFGTGIYATGPGGSRAEKIPWTYFKDGQFYTTYGMVAQPFWFPSMDIVEQYFKNYFRG
ncbi:HK97 gp10 family phage protein [Salinicoccus albus]|uniref:HK97 gp10 family phage protein n=1 Tax=Salinicoccus albus TaxID=418756 RepID=UPI00037623AD|nr:HK97 gp10 family phage protein [Salinicoccus albus]